MMKVNEQVYKELLFEHIVRYIFNFSPLYNNRIVSIEDDGTTVHHDWIDFRADNESVIAFLDVYGRNIHLDDQNREGDMFWEIIDFYGVQNGPYQNCELASVNIEVIDTFDEGTQEMYYRFMIDIIDYENMINE